MKTNSKIALLAAGVALSVAAVASAYADNGQRGMMRYGDDGPRYGRNMQEGIGPGNMDPRGMRPGNMGPGGMGRGEGPGFDRMFQMADKDNSGTVTLEEFEAASPLSIASADANNDGNVSVDELTDSLMREAMKRRAERMIERLDANNDGQLSVAEIQNQEKRMFDRFDIDGSGAIEKDEIPQPRGGMQGRGDGQGFGGGQGFQHRQGGFGRF